MSTLRSLRNLSTLSIAILCGPAFSQTTSPAAHITVDANRSLGSVNPWVFGGNLISYQKGGYGDTSPMGSDRGEGVWDPDRQRTVPEMAALEREAGLSVTRWPGGCATHVYEWKRTIGPLSERHDQRFGLPEYLRHCADIGAVPLISVAEYRGTAQDAADLVEYLNSPNDGKHPWAAKRAADGHPAAWNVIWFEFGNESEHGPHTSSKDFKGRARFTPEEYAHNYLAYRAAMRSIDPRIKLGAVVATGFPDLGGWARTVTRLAGKEMDFAIHHSYKVSYGGNDPNIDTKALFSAGLACAAPIQDYYNKMRRMFREACGRDDIPIAVTEFNGAFVQENPVPFRHSLGNALVNAEMLRVFLRPANHIVMANFWEFANEYWGAVKGWAPGGEALVKRPQFYPFALYHEHFGKQLIAVSVACPTYDTPGGYGVEPAMGKGSEEYEGPEVPITDDWHVSDVKGAAATRQGRELSVVFDGSSDLNYYFATRTIPAKPNTTYRLTGWVKTDTLTTSNGGCFQIGDARGWPATHSCSITPSVIGTADWTKVQVDYQTLPDTHAITLTARRLEGAGPVSGRASYRDLSLHEFTPHRYGAVPWLGVDASRSVDRAGKTHTYLIIVNRRLDGPVSTSITVRGMQPRQARAWILSGPTIDATNEKDPETVSVHSHDLGPIQNGFTLDLPPASMTAVAID